MPGIVGLSRPRVARPSPSPPRPARALTVEQAHLCALRRASEGARPRRRRSGGSSSRAGPKDCEGRARGRGLSRAWRSLWNGSRPGSTGTAPRPSAYFHRLLLRVRRRGEAARARRQRGRHGAHRQARARVARCAAAAAAPARRRSVEGAHRCFRRHVRSGARRSSRHRARGARIRSARPRPLRPGQALAAERPRPDRERRRPRHDARGRHQQASPASRCHASSSSATASRTPSTRSRRCAQRVSSS